MPGDMLTWHRDKIPSFGVSIVFAGNGESRRIIHCFAKGSKSSKKIGYILWEA